MVKLRRVESNDSLPCLEELGNVQELFGGRIGKVNADRKDATKVVNALNQAFNSGKKRIDFDNDSPKDMFMIIGGFNYKDRDYKLQIYENYSEPKKKICVDLKTWTGKSLGSVNGLILDPEAIVASLKKVMKVNHIKWEDCTSAEQYKKWRDKKFKEQQALALAIQAMVKDHKPKPPKPHHGKPDDPRPPKPDHPTDNIPNSDVPDGLAYNFGTLADYSYSRIDQDPYSTAWV